MRAFKGEPGYKVSLIGPIFLKGEYGISDNVGLGLNIAFFRPKATYTSTDFFTGAPYVASVDLTTISALARVNYHFGENDKFDPYMGFGIGYRYGKWTITDQSYSGSLPSFPIGFRS